MKLTNLALLWIVAAGGAAHADGPTPPPPAGAVPAEANRVLAGQLRLLDGSLDQVVQSLEKKSLADVAPAIEQLGLAYTDAGDLLQNAFRRHGACRTRLELAQAMLERLQTSPEEGKVTDDRLAALTGGVTEARRRLVEKLSGLNAELAASQTAAQRRQLLKQMELLSERIEQLDAILASKDEAAADRFAAGELAAPLKELAGELELEQELLLVMARAVAELAENAVRHTRKALDYLAVESDLPYEMLEELRGVRRSMHQLLGRLDTLRRVNTVQVREAMSRRPTESLADGPATETALLERVGRLLKPADAASN